MNKPLFRYITVIAILAVMGITGNVVFQLLPSVGE